MTLRTARILIVLVGILLPYLARLPGGWAWLQQYQPTDWHSVLLIGGFNAVAWGALLLLSFVYRYPASLWPPVLIGFGFLAWAHGGVDLLEDAQSAIALVFIPVYALGAIVAGAVLGFGLDGWLARRAKRRQPANAAR